MRHSIGSKQPVTKGKILSPPTGTHKEFACSKLATIRVSKGKSSKKSIPGIGKPSLSTMKKTTVSPKELPVSIGNIEEQLTTGIPAVPVLRSLPPFGPCVWHTSSPAQLVTNISTNKSNSDSVSDMDVITSVAADTACNTLTSVPRTWAATPMPPLRPGSALDDSLSWSVPSTHPPSRAVTPWLLQ